MTDNVHKLSMARMCDISKRNSTKLHTTVPYHPMSSIVAERMIGVLTNAVCAMFHNSGLPKSLCDKLSAQQCMFTIGSTMKALDGHTFFRNVVWCEAGSC